MNKTKENLEAGMYFSFKKTWKSYTNDVYNIETSKDGFMTLHRNHTHSKTGEYIPIDLVVVRRIGENSLDYYKHDMFGKKTRGRIHYKDIDCFIGVAIDTQGKYYTQSKKAIEIEKCPVEGIDAIGI